MSTILQTLKQLAPHGNPAIINGIAPFIEKYRVKYKVDTPIRMKHFLAQAAHETDGFATLREYASGAAYEGRADLGNTQPGDGIRFRGRGIFQTTGRSNYRTASTKIFGDERLLSQPELLEQYEWAVLAAFIYWDDKKLNAIADQDTGSNHDQVIMAITKKINGGYNGLQQRETYYARIKDWVINNPGITTILIIGIALFAIGAFFVVEKTILV